MTLGSSARLMRPSGESSGVTVRITPTSCVSKFCGSTIGRILPSLPPVVPPLIDVPEPEEVDWIVTS